jgi:predicted transcriptional regulator of viral defense system
MAKPLQKIMRYVGQNGIVRPRDIEAIGLPREYLIRLHRQGRLSRAGRGLYTLPDANVTERHSYAEVAKRVPEAVICLLSALAFHEITTQSPPAIWIALRKGARRPAITSPSLRIVRLSGRSLTEPRITSSKAFRFTSIQQRKPLPIALNSETKSDSMSRSKL